MTEIQVLLTEPDHYLTICKSSTLGDVVLIASSPDGAGGIVRLNFTEVGKLINDLNLLRAELPAATADNCRDCDENNSGVPL